MTSHLNVENFCNSDINIRGVEMGCYNDDMHNMFRSHEYSGLTDIELYVMIQQAPESQNFDQSQLFEESTEEEHTEVEAVDEEA